MFQQPNTMNWFHCKFVLRTQNTLTTAVSGVAEQSQTSFPDAFDKEKNIEGFRGQQKGIL